MCRVRTYDACNRECRRVGEPETGLNPAEPRRGLSIIAVSFQQGHQPSSPLLMASASTQRPAGALSPVYIVSGGNGASGTVKEYAVDLSDPETTYTIVEYESDDFYANPGSLLNEGGRVPGGRGFGGGGCGCN